MVLLLDHVLIKIAANSLIDCESNYKCQYKLQRNCNIIEPLISLYQYLTLALYLWASKSGNNDEIDGGLGFVYIICVLDDMAQVPPSDVRAYSNIS